MADSERTRQNHLAEYKEDKAQAKAVVDDLIRRAEGYDKDGNEVIASEFLTDRALLYIAQGILDHVTYGVADDGLPGAALALLREETCGPSRSAFSRTLSPRSSARTPSSSSRPRATVGAARLPFMDTPGTTGYS